MEASSLRLRMLRLAGSARSELPRSPERTIEFLTGCIRDDGGFRGRGDRSDLYYTGFGIEALLALGGEMPADRVASFLRGFGEGEGLDLVHLCSLVRCWADLGGVPEEATRRKLLARLAEHRSADGGYAPVPGSDRGTGYACFLAMGACQDLCGEAPDPDGLVRCLEPLRTAGGGYANSQSVPIAATPTTAAAMVILCELARPVEPSAAEWLLERLGEDGGFRPFPGAPAEDLLSTATALYALRTAGANLSAIREPARRFILDLLTDEGSFRGSAADERGDCEYTWYALLGLGILASPRRRSQSEDA